ncbi:SDR family oxidoreductase [Vibrio natriegens]|uniref:3-oxoacyl-[acyl-carrier-protein] reductase FabG n=1 Tax=Vibrio natriegens NBRC 15636 = ATCC 14048 = DSM 759 TaxID=1219067 RepID=A0AAN0Y7K9_VIBNA|nr:SDR family oxidoreductase [Vibrio natriegens]ALR17994.1 sugar dehydrogenase [Vibrio natriegens NBRC 15636 = ATCC 14048 = DSM 759]ANQ15492.1 NAD(P)-dependent oxidoreductase [Vibrio natriegens NBRC 15636 = ATCC 14048 = DSM 759]EPM41459.1 oxidoreductase [Vibrio natriegens NBRC 15636 = ATCC 14048 = DSM 759]MDX6029146.1 SDR family oxidoreductase [Vibrio natriegens NBRC 15636 = ATCC 14048 = DSM 759]UUI14147.1 SDR family oxidoreductase [Vibrio natriegens]
MTTQKVAIITGGGRGIGAATAQLFANNGYAVCINYKSNSESAAQLAETITRNGGKCITVQADVSQEEDVSRLFSTVDQELGQISVLVNNAGILKTQMRLEDMTADRINAILVNNVTSSFLCCREAVKRMSTRHGGVGGVIVNVSSGASRSGSPNEYIDYAASKGAIDTLTKGLSLEVASEGIRVNCVRPGLIHTDMHADGGEPERIERLKSVIPLQRGGKPEEVAEAIYWLASEKSSFSTGNYLDLAGGL